jgi:hypothetical protein
MATILARPRQQQAVTGRPQRTVLPDIIRSSASQVLAQRRFAQEQRVLDLQEEAQERQQNQELVKTGIQGVGTVLEGSGALKDLGIIGGTEAAAPAASGAASSAGLGASAAGPGSATTTGTLATTGGTTSVSGGTTQAAAPAATSTGLGLAGQVVGGAGAGLLGGTVAKGTEQHKPRTFKRSEAAAATLGFSEAFLNEEEQEKVSTISTGVTVGAGAGFVAGGPVGAAVGAVVGGLSASGVIDCIIVSACYGADSDEVDVTRAYRDAKMTKEQLRAYYFLGETLFVPKMEADEGFRQHVRQYLVDPLVRYGRFVVGMPMNAPPPSQEDSMIAQQFLNFLGALGQVMPPYTRQNGEVY